jgi:hypothetical protein
MMTDGERFLWGAIGAIVPEGVRLYIIITQQQHALPQFAPPYFIISAFFIALAGLFTIACKPKTRFKAIWIGIALPSIVSILVKAVPSLPTLNLG